MKYKISSFLVLLFLISACTYDFNPADEESAGGKIINTKAGSQPNILLVKLSSAPSDIVMDMLYDAGVESLTPVFTSTPGKEDLERACGLDLWYKITTSKEDLEAVAAELSGIEAVNLIEFNSLAVKASDCVVHPYDGVPLESDVQTKADGPFNDPYISDQWNYKNYGNASIATTAYKGGDINIYDVWNTLTTGDASIIVAVVDEGIDYTHVDLRNNMWINSKEYNGKEGVDDDENGYIDDIYGYNFVKNGNITWTNKGDSGHGTHCAGIIGAVNNNTIGISSVAGGNGTNNGVRLMSCQIFDGDEGGSAYVSSRAIKYAADMGASIISCSFGYKGGTYVSDGTYKRANGVEADALNYFESSKNNNIVDGGIVIFASGNDGDPYATYPGALSNVISVSAFGPDYLPTYYTNYGPGCNIVAPGGEALLPPWTSYKAEILSTVPYELYESNYGYMQGTSMACPHVSGIAALGLAYAKQLGKTFTLKEFKELIVTSANDFDKRLIGSKSYYNNAREPLELYPFMKKMGTGSIDTWLFMMKIEGVPSLLAQYGTKQWLDISDYFGTSSVNLTYLGVEISEKDKEALGLAEDPYIEYGRLYIYPTKVGSAKLTINAIGGGAELGGEDNIGGMEISQDLSIIVRSFKSSNGGWL